MCSMSVSGRTSIDNQYSQNTLINGDLVVYSFPTAELDYAGKYLVYRMVEDRALFWNILDSQIEAVSCASRICGHAVCIKELERP